MAAFVLVQPQPRATLAAQTLTRAGHVAIELPFHRLEPLADAIERLAQLELATFDRVVFSSPSSVAFSASVLRNRLSNVSIAAIGQGSATVLVESGLATDDASIIRPRTPPFDSAALCQLPEMSVASLQSILVIRGVEGRMDWIDRFREHGVRVQIAAIYHAIPTRPSAETTDQLINLMRAGDTSVVIVGSIAEFNGLTKWMNHSEKVELSQWLRAQPTIVPHGRIAQELASAGWRDLHSTRAGQTLQQAALELA